MDMEAVKRSLQKLQQLGYFKISEEPEFQVRPGRDEGRHHGQGARRRRATRSSSARDTRPSTSSSASSPFRRATSSVAARCSSASAQLGTISSFYDISYTIPWFIDQNQSIGVLDLPAHRELPEHRRAAAGHERLLRPRARTLRLVESALSVRVGQGELSRARARRSRRASPFRREKLTETTGRTSSLHAGVPLTTACNDPFDPTLGAAFLRERAGRGRRPRRLGLLHQADARRRRSTSPSASRGTPTSRVNLDFGWVADYQGPRDPDLRTLPARWRAEHARLPDRIDPAPAEGQPGLHRRSRAASSAATSSLF